MAQWGNTDDAANSVLWAATSVKLTANTDNQTALFGNTTADAFISGATVGQFAVDANEMQAARAGETAKSAHSGWVLRTEGSGGRAGRVQTEVLVAMNTIGTDDEDVVYKDYSVTITSNPSSASANATNNDIATFTVAAATTPTGGTLTYIWQKWNGSAFANLTNAGAYSNTTTATLSVLANTASNGEIYRARAASGGDSAFSANAVITITT